jgi:hypothetical protein
MDWPDGSVSPGSRRSLLVAEHGGDRAERHARAHRPFERIERVPRVFDYMF